MGNTHWSNRKAAVILAGLALVFWGSVAVMLDFLIFHKFLF